MHWENNMLIFCMHDCLLEMCQNYEGIHMELWLPEKNAANNPKFSAPLKEKGQEVGAISCDITFEPQNVEKPIYCLSLAKPFRLCRFPAACHILMPYC